MLRVAILRSVHAAVNIFFRHVHVRDDDVALDTQPCYSSPLSATKSKAKTKDKTLSRVANNRQ